MSGAVVFLLDKVVRDGVLKDMLERGQQPEYRQLEGEELLEYLVKKLQEEASELDPTSPTFDDELRDVQAVLDALVQHRGVSKEAFEALVQTRNTQRGGFEKAYYVGKLVLHADDPWVDYYRKEPERFKELKDVDD